MTVDERIRVLWLAKGLGPGGAERLLVAQARFADHERFAYQAAYLRPDKVHLVPELASLGVPAVCLGLAHPRDLRWVGRLRRLLVAGRIEVLHVHSPSVAALARVAARTVRPRPAVVYTEHNTWDSYGRPTRWMNRTTYGLDDAHVAVSNEVAASVPARRRAHLAVVVHGIDVAGVRAEAAHRSEVRESLGIDAGDVVIGMVANLRANKDYPTMLAAARELVDRRPSARFVAVGQGPLEAEIRARHAELGLGDRFLLLGYRPDVWRVMAGFDVLAFSSRFEGLPVALMEGRALGLPVVATAVGGLQQQVTEGVDGLLVPPGSPSALAAALERVVDDAALRSRLAEGSAACASRYDAAGVAPALEAIYEQVLAGRRAPRRQ